MKFIKLIKSEKYPKIIKNDNNKYCVLYAEGTKGKEFDTKEEAEQYKKSLKSSKNIKSSNDVESQALAAYLNVPTKNIKKVKDALGLPTYEVNNNGETQRYSISDNEKAIKKAVEESIGYLVEELTIPEFCKNVVPYLSGDPNDYFVAPDYEELPFDELLDSGAFDGVFGDKYEGHIYKDKLAEDVISNYGPAHELDHYDNRGDEINFDGRTFQIFRKE